MTAGSLPRHVPRKRFGQHFLIDRSVIEAIVRAVAPREGDELLEIGPGQGALTDALLQRIGHLSAVEIDRDLARRLRARHPAGRLTLIEADALRFDYGRATGRWRLVGNLPYNISSPLLVHLLACRDRVADQHFMLQKEVVERIAAAPGGSGFGRLSVLLQAYYEVEALFAVPPQAFDPPPAVDSAVLRMTVRRTVAGDDTASLQRLLAAGFAQRRKMIRKTLLPWLAGHGVRVDDLDPAARPEDLGVTTWLGLAGRLREAEGR